ncbi:predicted protein [Postia placenta Mad-698-R]|uniref:Uncharacterized protein n=1 Tax=Postia placenta MAD-698-R-SB12 TaxID=670580 RepID=A0A1X6MNQ9_9APHY|nr:hypothetical protein POSPLADRAFT_1049742 [Postia placenta MAD-698-R-SB12]EED84062.1 predicted protein [Postia placenta Mad-698-R]OSX58015.1 hypothetical protein POSPLADRAFT_1049742 [Postia placenta MAD-698-R-SB12]
MSAVSTSYHLRPVSDAGSPSSTASTSTASEHSPHFHRKPSVAPLQRSASAATHARRPLSPSSLRAHPADRPRPAPPTELDLSVAQADMPRRYPAPPTGHDLMALFPPAPPLTLSSGPTSGYFQQQERAFFAKKGKEIVRCPVQAGGYRGPRTLRGGAAIAIMAAGVVGPCYLGLLLHLWAFRTPLMAHTHTYRPTRRRGDQEGREGLFGARTTMQEGARCPSQETDRSAGARCFALQGIRILLPWERPHWHNDEAWSPDPASELAPRAESTAAIWCLADRFMPMPMPMPVPVLMRMTGGIMPALRALTLTRPARAARLRPSRKLASMRNSNALVRRADGRRCPSRPCRSREAVAGWSAGRGHGGPTARLAIMPGPSRIEWPAGCAGSSQRVIGRGSARRTQTARAPAGDPRRHRGRREHRRTRDAVPGAQVCAGQSGRGDGRRHESFAKMLGLMRPAAGEPRARWTRAITVYSSSYVQIEAASSAKDASRGQPITAPPFIGCQITGGAHVEGKAQAQGRGFRRTRSKLSFHTYTRPTLLSSVLRKKIAMTYTAARLINCGRNHAWNLHVAPGDVRFD